MVQRLIVFCLSVYNNGAVVRCLFFWVIHSFKPELGTDLVCVAWLNSVIVLSPEASVFTRRSSSPEII